MELTLFSAVVQARDGVLFEGAADSAHELVTEVAAFVRRRCVDVLWPDDAQRVCGLLDQRNPYAAIALYFARVGDRWDEEWLELSLPIRDSADATQRKHGAGTTAARCVTGR
ncbi:MAG: hypothetical protein ACREOK_07505 [Gemmatimonadaceae bacterium]